MRRLTTLIFGIIVGAAFAAGAYAAPPGDDDDDNPPQQTVPAQQPKPAPSPSVAAPPPVVTTPPPVAAAPQPAVSAAIRPISPSGEVPPAPQTQPTGQVFSQQPTQQPVVTPTSPTSATITMSSPGIISPPSSATAPPAAAAVAPIQPNYGAPLPALPAEPVAPPVLPDPKIAELSTGVDRVRANFELHQQQAGQLHQQRGSISVGYYRTTGDINSRLATGAVPGDQALLGELQRAQQLLDTLQANTNQLTGLSTALTDDSSSVLSLAQQIRRELDIPGKSASDRVALAGVEGKISAAQAEIDQWLRNTLGELARENHSIAVEQHNLEVMAREIRSGALESDRTLSLRSNVVNDDPAPTPAALAVGSGSRPLAVITRDAAGQSYERQLYAAVSGILKHSPNASFTVQATTPGRVSGATKALAASDAQRKADDVVRSLSTFGLSRSRIIETEGTDESLSEPEVEVFGGAGAR